MSVYPNPQTPILASVSEAKAAVLSSALSRSLEALDGFRSALAGKPVTDARWHRLASLDTTVDEVGEIYYQSSHSPKMTDIGIVWFVAKEIVEAWQNKQTSPPGSA